MSHLPGGALIAKEDAGVVAKHTEASYTKCGALLVRSLEVWCVTSRAGHSRAFQRINGENVLDIQVFGFISPIFCFCFTVWVYLTCQSWGSRLQHTRLQRGALQFSPQLLVSSLTFISPKLLICHLNTLAVTLTPKTSLSWGYVVLVCKKLIGETSSRWRIDKSILCSDWASHLTCKFCGAD